MQAAGLRRTQSKTAIVAFHTQFGNTEKIARSLTSGLALAGVAATCLSIAEVQPDDLRKFDLVVIGAPTQAFSAAKPVKDFLDRLEGSGGLSGKLYYAFDTKLPSRFSGSAAKLIGSKLEHIGLVPAAPRSSAIGRGGDFKLDDGEVERFEKIGLELGTVLKGK